MLEKCNLSSYYFPQQVRQRWTRRNTYLQTTELFLTREAAPFVRAGRGDGSPHGARFSALSVSRLFIRLSSTQKPVSVGSLSPQPGAGGVCEHTSLSWNQTLRNFLIRFTIFWTIRNDEEKHLVFTIESVSLWTFQNKSFLRSFRASFDSHFPVICLLF